MSLSWAPLSGFHFSRGIAKSETIDGKSGSATGLGPWGEAAVTLAPQKVKASHLGLWRHPGLKNGLEIIRVLGCQRKVPMALGAGQSLLVPTASPPVFGLCSQRATCQRSGVQAEQCPPVPPREWAGAVLCVTWTRMGTPSSGTSPPVSAPRVQLVPGPGGCLGSGQGSTLCSSTVRTLLLGSGHTTSGSSEDSKPSQMRNDFHEPWLLAQSKF